MTWTLRYSHLVNHEGVIAHFSAPWPSCLFIQLSTTADLSRQTQEFAVQELTVRCLVLVVWTVGSVFQQRLSGVMSPDYDVLQIPSSEHSSNAANGEGSADKM